jgi:hypothetical protein
MDLWSQLDLKFWRRKMLKQVPEMTKNLLAVADLIETKGHCQNGRHEDSKGRICLVTAIRMIVFPFDKHFPSFLDQLQKEIDLITTLEVYLSLKDSPTQGLVPLAYWSDNTPTIELLSKIRECAHAL